MFSTKPARMMATIRDLKLLDIGGRPVLANNTKSAATRYGAQELKLGLAFLAIYLIWGSTYLAIRYAVESIPPLVVAGIRHSIAGVIMLGWAYWRGFRPARREWVGGLVLGFLFFLVGHGSLHWAEQYVDSGLAALLIATEPMFILVLGRMLGQQKISRVSAAGLALGVIGVATLTGIEAAKGSSLLGLLAVLLGSLSWSIGVVISPRLKLPSHALGRTALPTLCGAVMLLIAAGATGEFHRAHWAAVSVNSLFGLGYLIIFGSIVAFTSYIWLLQRVPPALVATHTYANPIVAVLLGWWLAHEPLTPRVVLASVAILGAILLIRRGENAVMVKAPQKAQAAETGLSECA